MPGLSLNGVRVADTFAEAFDMAATGIVITADSPRWAEIAATTMTGFATSVIGCGVEAAIDAPLPPEETPDGRPGVRVLLFGFDAAGLKTQVIKRVGQCVLTSPDRRVYAGTTAGRGSAWAGRARLRRRLRGRRSGSRRRLWRIPVMDGEFVCEHDTGLVEGVGGGNLIFLGRDGAGRCGRPRPRRRAGPCRTRSCPSRAAMVRSGSKVGSRYSA